MQSTTNSARSYRVLTQEEREEIMIGVRRNESARSIANRLERNVSVISRELKNNSTEDFRYQAYWAQKRSERRRCKSRQRERIADQYTRQYMHEKLRLGWSPEQIAGRICLDMPGKRLSYETIYQYVFKKDRSLTKYLVCGRKNRRKRIHKRGKRILIPHRTGIEKRPEKVNKREELGHWEADTAVSRQSKEALMVLQERTMGLTLLQKLPRCAPKEMNSALIARLESFPETMRRTVTFDNGQENRHHNQLCDELKIKTFFCNPYSSWEKGSVENAVGLTRREWPKKTNYALISDEEIATLEHRLNTRPRKRLGYRTPLELLASVALSP
ncbi:MAG: IS30 family transposase [Spirochaetales bacterium]|jgi:transposase, IS30 family|nr:IS30 family transposase [Spirochaetales bacterium]